MEIKNTWAFDECTDCNQLFEKLDTLQEEGKISWRKTDGWIFYIEDLEMDDEDVDDLLKLFEDLDVYSSDEDMDKDSDWADDWEDF